MIELRYYKPLGEENFKLQFRELIPSGDNTSVDWTEWKDVPLVTEKGWRDF